MIAVDTSALMAILLGEPDAAALATDRRTVISACTVAEALIVAERRGLRSEMGMLIDGLGLEVLSVTPATARQAADAYARWGKVIHAAGLNFGDCFAYVAAKAHDCPLLFVGADFSRTDEASPVE